VRLPFTIDQFFEVFRRYNLAVWPSQLVLLGLAVAALAFGMLGGQRNGRRVNVILALLWLWMAVAYHITFFASVNRAALVFGIAFAVQAALFARLAFGPHAFEYRPRANGAGFAGAIFVFYALIGYPALGRMFGHRYPAAPTFGVPCPTTIFTLGLLLWGLERLPWRVVVVPLLWAGVGTSAAVTLGMTEDFGLPLAGIVTIGFVVDGRRRARRTRLDAVGVAA
jgi:hypothetical protein